MFGTILLIVAVLILVLNLGIAALRGFSKSAIRFLTVLISAVTAVVVCLVLKANLPSPEKFFSENDFSSLGGELGNLFQKLVEYGEISPTLLELAVQLVGALTLPVVCLVIFCLVSFLTWVIYLILKAVLKLPLKGLDALIPMSRLVALPLGLLQGLAVIAILFLPLSGYLSIAQPTVDGLVEQEVLHAEDPTIQKVQSVIDEMEQAPVLNLYRTLGGQTLSDSMMEMHIAGMDVKLEEELDSVIGVVMQIADLSGTPMANYGNEEAAIIRNIGESFDDSKLLAPIVGDILYAATDAWLNGEEFLGVAKPTMGEATELFGPFADALLEVLHDDAKDAALLQADIKTMAEVIATLSQHGVFANLNNMDSLLTTLGGEGVVKSLINTLGANPSTARLIPEVTNLGVRAIGQALNMPADVDAVYGELMSDVADALNHVSTLPADQQTEALSARLDTAFDEAGVAIDDEVLDFYSTSMLHDLVENNPADEVTSADVQAFFVLYSENVLEDETTASAGFPGFDLLAGEGEDIFAGTVYEGMTSEERSQTATAKLAELCTELSKLNAEDENFAEKAKNMVVESFTEILGEDHAALETLKNTQMTKPVSSDSIQNTVNMKSSDAMKDSTTVITMETLMVDGKAAAEKLTGENIELEADAIEAIFGTVNQLLDTLNSGDGEMDMALLAESVGTILDSLNLTDTFGRDKTAELFTAIMQSEKVRESAGMDMKTATEMAAEATRGDGSYTDTMSTVADSVNIVDQLTKDGKVSDDELVKLVQNLTPQTAGMVRVYINEERMMSFGVPANRAGISAELVSSVFTYMSREDLKDYDAEAKGLNQVLQIALSAKTSDSRKLFSTAVGAEDGKLPTARETVERMLGSESVVFAITDVLTDGTRVTSVDAFGFASKLEKDTQGKTDLQNAIADHRAAHPEISDLTYEALAALFGLEMRF